MKQLVARMSILSTLALAAGCTDEASVLDETPTGKAAFALASGDYEIGVSIEIFAAGDDPQADEPVATGGSLIGNPEASFTISLPAGDDYQPALTEWSISGPGITGTATDALSLNVEFEGFTPAAIDITTGDTTGVTMTFIVDTEPVVISFPPGGAVIAATVEIDDGCDPVCGGAQVCVTGGPVAQPTCVTPCDFEDPGDTCVGQCIEVSGTVPGGGICELP